MLEATKMMGQFKVLSHISSAQPFVILPDEEEQPIEDNFDPLDLPFKVCSFELLSTNSKNTMWFKNPSTGELTEVVCVIAEEIEPQKIIFYVFASFNGGPPEIRWFHPDDFGSDWWAVFNSLIQKFLGQLKSGNYGFSSPRTVFKWKENGTKNQIRVNKVIYINPSRKNEESSILKTPFSITWSHAFWVMGHWRAISGVGKDRNGVYQVNGKTWVVPHIKNKEAGDPITKARIITNTEVNAQQ